MVVTKTLTKDLFDSLKEKTISHNTASILDVGAITNIKVENVYFVLPAYNEEESLPTQLNRISELKTSKNVKVNVVVVNDGSSDNTEHVAKQSPENLNLTLVNHEKNMGLGQAVQTGIKEALSQAGI